MRPATPPSSRAPSTSPRLVYRASELWQTGALIPSPGDPDTLTWALEYAVTMGASPSSQILQRFGNATNQQIGWRMDAQEAQRRPALRPPLRAALERRDSLPPTCYGSQAKLHNALQYTDDLGCKVGGVANYIDYLLCVHEVVGPDGLNLPLSRASKQQAGIAVTWLDRKSVV